MSLNIHISINSDSDRDLTPHELGILRALANTGDAAPAVEGAASTAKTAKQKDTPTLKSAPTPAPEEDEASPEESSGGTLEDAVSRATALVSQGKTASVKEALAATGAKRVSELKGAMIGAFLKALDA